MNVTVVAPQATGVDYSFARPNPVELRRLGFSFVCRYITTTATSPKALTSAERDRLHAAGLAIVLVFEVNEVRQLAGSGQGSIDGDIARRQALALGYPVQCPIIVAIDTDVIRATLAVTLEYVMAFARTSGHPLGCYGDTDILNALGGNCVLGWLPNARGWSPQPSSRVHVQQEKQRVVAGGMVDTNTCVRPFTAWLPEVELPPVPQPIPPMSEEDDMAKPLMISVKGDATRGPALWYPDTCSMYGLGPGDAVSVPAAVGAAVLEVSAQTYDDARTKALVEHGYGHIVGQVYVPS